MSIASIREHFIFLKSATSVNELLARSVALPCGGALVPIGKQHEASAKAIADFAAWRDAHQYAYPTRFPVTKEGTACWLRRQVINNPDRILFMILDGVGQPVGHIGLLLDDERPEVLEIDNVLRGEEDNPGIMGEALSALIEWAGNVLFMDCFFLKVLKSNEHAVRFYLGRGFCETARILLKKEEKRGFVRFVTMEDAHDEPDDVFLVLDYKESNLDFPQERILTAGPSISAIETSYACDAARYGWNHQWSKYLNELEEFFCDYIGVKHALATSCCTGAMHMALLALGIGPGDEVIVPDITWVATAQVVNYVGATPVFADIDPKTWCMDPESFKSRLSKKTKAVMPVHLYGHPAKMDEITKIAKKHGMYIVEDAAPAIGAEFKGQRTGSFGDFSAFSFQGAKLVIAGEGGMLLTDDDDLYTQARKLWDQGRVPGTFWIDTVGWKYKMSNIQAAIGLGQMERVDALIAAKRRLFSWYEEGLSELPGIVLQHEADWARSIYWMSNITVTEECPLSRDELIKALADANVDTRPVFPAISQYPIWPVESDPCPVSKRVGETSMNLPSGVCLKKNQIDYVCRSIEKVVR